MRSRTSSAGSTKADHDDERGGDFWQEILGLLESIGAKLDQSGDRLRSPPLKRSRASRKSLRPPSRVLTLLIKPILTIFVTPAGKPLTEAPGLLGNWPCGGRQPWR
jgi:hypothetical protein